MASSASTPPSAAVDSLAASLASLSQRMAELRQYAEQKLAAMGRAPASARVPAVAATPTPLSPSTTSPTCSAPTTATAPVAPPTPAVSSAVPVLLFGVPIGFTSAASASPTPPTTSTPTAPSTPAASPAAPVLLFGVPIGFISTPTTAPPPSSTAAWSPPYLMTTKITEKHDGALLSLAVGQETPSSACTTAVLPTPSAPTTASTPPITAVAISFRVPTPPYLAPTKKITKTATREPHASTAVFGAAGVTRKACTAAAARRACARAHAAPFAACQAGASVRRLCRLHHRARLRPRRRGSGASRPRTRSGRARLSKPPWIWSTSPSSSTGTRSSPSIQPRRWRTPSSSSTVASRPHGRLHGRVSQADDQHVSDNRHLQRHRGYHISRLEQASRPPSAALKAFDAMPSYPLFVSLCGAMTSAVVLHALAADQDAAHFSVSLYAGKPASRDQFRKAYLKDGEASHSGGHKVLHHAVSAGSCYGEYTNFIQLLLKTRANPNISDELRRLSMEIVELCECKEEEERRLPFTLLIPNVRKWSVAGVHSHAKSENTKLLDKIHFAGRRRMIKSQVDLAFRQECDMAFKFYYLGMDIEPEAILLLYSKRSLCKLRMGAGEGALSDANQYSQSDVLVLLTISWPPSALSGSSVLETIQPFLNLHEFWQQRQVHLQFTGLPSLCILELKPWPPPTGMRNELLQVDRTSVSRSYGLLAQNTINQTAMFVWRQEWCGRRNNCYYWEQILVLCLLLCTAKGRCWKAAGSWQCKTSNQEQVLAEISDGRGDQQAVHEFHLLGSEYCSTILEHLIFIFLDMTENSSVKDNSNPLPNTAYASALLIKQQEQLLQQYKLGNSQRLQRQQHGQQLYIKGAAMFVDDDMPPVELLRTRCQLSKLDVALWLQGDAGRDGNWECSSSHCSSGMPPCVLQQASVLQPDD